MYLSASHSHPKILLPHKTCTLYNERSYKRGLILFLNFLKIFLKIFLQIIFIYPLLQKRIGISNLRLALFGLLFKIGSVIILAFTKTSLIAFMSIFLSIFGRFVSTGLRAIASACVNVGEQGKKNFFF